MFLWLWKLVKPVVLEDKSHMEYWAEIKPVLESYAESLDRRIFVRNPHGTSSEARTDPGMLYIRFWSAPVRAEETHSKITRAFGIDLQDGQRDVCAASGRGIPIVDLDGVTVAEVVGGTLYVLFDLPHGVNAGQLMGRIMEGCEIVLTLSPQERERLLAEALKQKERFSKEEYVRECLNGIENMRAAATRALEGALAKRAEYSQGLTEAIRGESALRRELEGLDRAAEGDTAGFSAEFDRLTRTHKVERVHVTSGIIHVFTDHLYTQPLTKDKSVRDLGKYRIDIFTNGNVPSVYNLTREVDRRSHPHTSGGHTLCLGNIQEGITKLIAEYQFAVVAGVLIQFLETINEGDDYGRRVYDWPIAKGGAR